MAIETNRPALIASPEQSMKICNACRYCENLCAVFPAMTKMREFDDADLDYLANLCHQCGACYDACQYSPPHPFAVDLPLALAGQRSESYARMAPSQSVWELYQRFGALAGTWLAIAIALLLAIVSGISATSGEYFNNDGDFYRLLSHGLMVTFGGITFVFGIVGCIVSSIKFKRRCGPDRVRRDALRAASADALSLRYLGDDLCENERGHRRSWQRQFHHYLTIGFGLCFLSTSIGTLTHYVFNNPAPYPWYSLTGLFGIVGGVAMSIGGAGLLLIKMQKPLRADVPSRAMDINLVLLLFAVAVTGLILRLFGDSVGLGLLLFVHLGFVFSLFACLPFSKMVHVPYRVLALIRYHS